MVNDSNREIGTVLSYILGRQLRTGEIVNALGVSRSAYYLARDEGRLTNANNLIRLAKAFGINPVDLLVRYGMISRESVLDYAMDAANADHLRAAEAAERQSRPMRAPQRVQAVAR